MFPGALLHVVSIWICVLQGVSTNKQICSAPQLFQYRDIRLLIFPIHIIWTIYIDPPALSQQFRRIKQILPVNPGTATAHHFLLEQSN